MNKLKIEQNIRNLYKPFNLDLFSLEKVIITIKNFNKKEMSITSNC